MKWHLENTQEMLVQIPTSTNIFIPWNHHWIYHSLSRTTPSCVGKHCLVVRRHLLNEFVHYSTSLTAWLWHLGRELWSPFLMSCELPGSWASHYKACVVGAPLWLPHSTPSLLSLVWPYWQSLRSPDVPRGSLDHLFPWQRSFLILPVPSLLISLRSWLQCDFLKKLPVVFQAGSDVLIITLIFTCIVPSYLSCNFIFVSVIVGLRAAHSQLWAPRTWRQTCLCCPLCCQCSVQFLGHREALSVLMFFVPHTWLSTLMK